MGRANATGHESTERCPNLNYSQGAVPTRPLLIVLHSSAACQKEPPANSPGDYRAVF